MIFSGAWVFSTTLNIAKYLSLVVSSIMYYKAKRVYIFFLELLLFLQSCLGKGQGRKFSFLVWLLKERGSKVISCGSLEMKTNNPDGGNLFSSLPSLLHPISQRKCVSILILFEADLLFSFYWVLTKLNSLSFVITVVFHFLSFTGVRYQSWWRSGPRRICEIY